jgi:hypothetical protein
MRTLQSFSGTRKVSLLGAEDFSRVREQMFDNDFREVYLFTKRDFDLARENNCKIYCKSYEFDDMQQERYFIRISKEDLFRLAEK